MGSESTPATAPSLASLVRESDSWWDYVNSRDRTGKNDKTDEQTAERVSSSAFVAHMKNLMLARSNGVRTGISGGRIEDGAVSRFLRTPLDEEGLQDPMASFNRCPLGGYSLQLLDGKIFPCNRGALLGIANERFGTAFAHEEDDYIELDAIRSVEDIDSMRRRAHPMCRYCATSLDERIEWRRSTLDRYEWLMRPDERK